MAANVIPPIDSQNPGFRFHWTEMQQEFAECFRTGQLTNNGPHVQQFERNLAAFLGVETEQIVIVDHGQSALVLALKQMNFPAGSCIGVPDMTFTGTVSAVLAAGL